MAVLRRLGWQRVLGKLVAKYPERLNLNMACGLIGAELGIDWRDIPKAEKDEAKALIKSLKPKKQTSVPKVRVDESFVEFVVMDQLSSLDIEVRRMFGARGLYLNGRFVAIIHGGTLYLKTSAESRQPFIEAGMKPFQPNKNQIIKSYYQVPGDIVEDADELCEWFKVAAKV